MSSNPGLVVPYVTEQSPRGERTMDIYSRLLNDRIVFLGTPVDDQVANAIIAQLLHLDSEDPKQDINVYINSPGGSVTAGLAGYDGSGDGGFDLGRSPRGGDQGQAQRAAEHAGSVAPAVGPGRARRSGLGR